MTLYTPTQVKTFRGIAELYYVTTSGEPAVETEHLIAAGKGTVTRSFSVDKHVSMAGSSFGTLRSDLTEIGEEIKIETDQVTDNILCIAYGVALETALTTKATVANTMTRKTGLRLKFFDLKDTTTPKFVRDGFTGVLTIDGDISMGKDGVGTVTVKCDVEDTFGTVLGYNPGT